MFRILTLVVFVGCTLAADFNSGMEKFRNRDYDGAAQEMRAVLESEPDNTEAKRVLGLSLVRQGKTDEAIGVLEGARESGADLQLALAAAYAGNKRYDDAERTIAAAAEAKGDHEELPFYRGMVKVLKKQYRDSVGDLEAAIEKNPENAYAYYYAGLAYSNTKRPDKMMNAFNNFLKLEPNAPESAKVRSFMRSSR